MYLHSSGMFRGSNGIVGLPYNIGQGSGLPGQLKAQNCYVEVNLGCYDKTAQKNANSHNFPQSTGTESPALGRGTLGLASAKPQGCEKLFIYPPEAVLVPVMQASSARSSLKRYYYCLGCIFLVNGWHIVSA